MVASGLGGGKEENYFDVSGVTLEEGVEEEEFVIAVIDGDEVVEVAVVFWEGWCCCCLLLSLFGEC